MAASGAAESATSPSVYQARVRLARPASPQPISARIWGVNLETWSQLDALLPYAPAARLAGIRVLRFLGGCSGETYDWKRARLVRVENGTTQSFSAMPVADALRLAEACGAEILYQLNVETRGLRNPCGMVPGYPGLSEEENTRILLQDARDLLTSFGEQIRWFELGNEPWGSWTGEDYTTVALQFARELKRVDSGVKVLVVGHPSSGNNMAPSIPETRKPRDHAWTRCVQELLQARCGETSCIDLITDHPYVFAGFDPFAANDPGNFKGVAAWYPPVMYRPIFADRMKDYNGRLAITEWNIKVWEVGSPTPVALPNAGFENGLEGWELRSAPPDAGRLDLVTSGAAEGRQSVRLVLLPVEGASSTTAELVRDVEIPAAPKGRFRLQARLRISEPAQVTVLVDADTSSGSRATLAKSSMAALRANEWQPILIDGGSGGETTQAQLLVRAYKSERGWKRSPALVSVEVDDVRLLSTDGWSPPLHAPGTVEHGMFVASTLLEMAAAGVTIANHHNFGQGDGGLFASTSTLNTCGEGFALTGVLGDGYLLDTETSSPEKELPKGNCRTIRCLRGGIRAPYLSAYAGLNAAGDRLHLFLVNRHEKEGAQVFVSADGLPSPAPGAEAEVVCLSASDYTERQFGKTERKGPSAAFPMNVDVPPISLTRVTVPLAAAGDNRAAKKFQGH